MESTEDDRSQDVPAKEAVKETTRSKDAKGKSKAPPQKKKKKQDRYTKEAEDDLSQSGVTKTASRRIKPERISTRLA